jgi:hypothetical protein
MGSERRQTRGEGIGFVPTRASALGATPGVVARAASLSTRLLAALGLSAVLPTAIDAARRARRRDRDADNDKEREKDEASEEKIGKAEESEDEQVDAQDKSSGDDKRRNRDDQADGDDGGEKARRESRRQEASSDASDEEDGGGGGGRRRNRDDADAESAQDTGEDGLDDEPADTAPVTPPTTNPNVTLPDTSADPDDVELIVQSNPDVIAQTSTSGGFAFAQSGGVTAISGPDGARIVQTGEPDVVTPAPTPAPTPEEPAPDGGDNGVDFAS